MNFSFVIRFTYIKPTFFYIIGLCDIKVPLIKLKTLRKVSSTAFVQNVERVASCDIH